MTSDAAALRALMIHDAFLRRLAGRLVDASSADDVVQETWLIALRKAPREAAAAKAWLAQVARNVVAMDFRGRDRAERRERASAKPEAAPSAAEIVEREGVRRDVVEALLRLDPLYRDALLLRYERDLPPRKVAAALGVPVETARSRVKRGLELLRIELEGRRGPEQWRRSLGLLLAPAAARTTLAAGAPALLGGVAALLLAAWAIGGGDPVAMPSPSAAPVVRGTPLAAAGEPPAAATHPVARSPFSDLGFTILSDEETLEAFPCAEPVDAEGRPTIAATRIVDLVTGKPIPGAVVAMEIETPTPIGEAPRAYRSIEADAAGWARIRLDDLHGKPYGFFVSAPGYATFGDFGGRPECPVKLAPGRPLRVRAVDVFGEPLAGLRLDLVLGCGHHATRARYVTDAVGEATISDLADDGGSLWPVDPRVLTIEHEIALPATDDLTPLTLVGEPGAIVRGRVVRAGVPLAGVYVGAPHTHRGPWARTDAEGRFELFGAPFAAELEVVDATDPALSTADEPRRLGGMDPPPVGRRCTIDLARRGVEPAEPTIEVAVLCRDADGRPVHGVAVTALGAEGDVARGYSDAKGVALLKLFRGAYELSTDDPFSEGEVVPETILIDDAAPVRDVVEVRAVRRPRLKCSVSTEIEEAAVRLATSLDVRDLAPEERAGIRSFPVPAYGPVAILVDTPEGVVYRRRLDAERDAAGTIDGEPTPILVPKTPGALAIPPAALQVVVADADGKPLIDADVDAQERETAAPRRFQTRTQADGTASFPARELRGPLAAAVRAEGFAPYFCELRFDPTDPTPVRVKLPAGRVTVQVADESGAPLRHATVLIDGEPLYLRAGEASSVELRGLAAGTHEVVVAAPGRIARRLVIDLQEGGVAAWTTRLRKSL